MKLSKCLRVLLMAACAVALFWAGTAVGQNKFGAPSTIIHVSIIKWKDGVSAGEKKKALDGVKEMAAQIPGIKNVWIKGVRVQPQGFHDIFVIEFADKAAADTYAKHPAHDKWRDHFLSIREESISPQITN